MRSEKPEERALVEKVGLIWPNQADRGTHLNISGGGSPTCAESRGRRQVSRILGERRGADFICQRQQRMAIVKGAKLDNPALESLGQFKTDSLPLASLGKSQAAAQRIADKVGWK